MVLKLLLLIVIGLCCALVHYATGSDFLVAGGSDATEVIYRVGAVWRWAALGMVVLGTAWVVYGSGWARWPVLLAAICAFALAQTVVVYSGKHLLLKQNWSAVTLRSSPLPLAGPLTAAGPFAMQDTAGIWIFTGFPPMTINRVDLADMIGG